MVSMVAIAVLIGWFSPGNTEVTSISYVDAGVPRPPKGVKQYWSPWDGHANQHSTRLSGSLVIFRANAIFKSLEEPPDVFHVMPEDVWILRIRWYYALLLDTAVVLCVAGTLALVFANARRRARQRLAAS